MYKIEAVVWLASICTVGLFCTGIPICLKIFRKGNTSDTSSFPLVIMFCNATLWLKYGLMKGDNVLLYVNLIGSMLSLSYIGCYYIYAMQKSILYRQLIFACALLFPILMYVKYHAITQNDALYYLGFLCASSGVISYGAPLASAAEVLRSRSTECMALPLSVANFVVSIEWLTYGYLVEDLYVQVPNCIGTFLGVAQLSLFVIFPRQRPESGILQES